MTFLMIATFCAGLSCTEAEWVVEPATAIPHNCLAAFNEKAPEWLMRHPGYAVQRVRCASAERLGRSI